MELLHQSGEIIADRYRILDILGQGGIGITYEALDLQNNERVALKALSLRRMNDWKKMELFEREARILAQLHHPGIPHYLDYFQVDSASDRGFYIAQQLALGKSLSVLVENGWHPDENEVRDLATQILSILIYLQELTPPVIHRDIKPQNIILNSFLDQREERRTQVFLVDFGAVQDTYHNTVTGGSTVVGTYGYMAPEQFRGQAVLSTDLYGLGTTLLFLLTGKSPSDLPQRKLKIDFRSHVRLSKEFADWLETMLEPVIEDRFPSAKVALTVLRGEQVFTRSLSHKSRPPKDTPITLSEAEGQLFVEIPPVGLRSDKSRVFALLSLVWNAFSFLTIWVIAEYRYPIPLFLSNWVFFCALVITGVLILATFAFCAGSRTRLAIAQDFFQIQWRVLGLCYQAIQGRTQDINQVKLSGIGLPLIKQPLTVCVLRSKLSKYGFGLLLTQPEKQWLVGEITAFLEKLRDNSASKPTAKMIDRK
jgi:serine/threonine protein kinase